MLSIFVTFDKNNPKSTHINVIKMVLLLLRRLVVSSQGQVVNLGAFSQVHALRFTNHMHPIRKSPPQNAVPYHIQVNIALSSKITELSFSNFYDRFNEKNKGDVL